MDAGGEKSLDKPALFSYNFAHVYEINDLKIDPLAQLVEQFPFKEWAVGSNPTRVTIRSLLIGC